MPPDNLYETQLDMGDPLMEQKKLNFSPENLKNHPESPGKTTLKL